MQLEYIFGARKKKITFSAGGWGGGGGGLSHMKPAWPFPKTYQDGFSKFLKCKIWLHFCVLHIKMIEKYIYGSSRLKSGWINYDF